MRVLRGLMRGVGWLLTPIVAWAASFFGAIAVASLAANSSATAPFRLVLTGLGGGVAAALGLIGWLRLLRRSPALQETLEVEPDGTPSAAVD